jgi:hypothetical protein
VTTPDPRPQHADSGATLILAIGFMVVISLVGGALAMLVSSGLGNRTPLQNLRSTQYSADGAIEYAISHVRGLPKFPCEMPGFLRDSDPPALNNIAIRVDWVPDCTRQIQSPDGTFLIQRDVTFSACADTDSVCETADVITRAQVNFQQQEADGPVTKTYVLSWSVNR